MQKETPWYFRDLSEDPGYKSLNRATGDDFYA